MAYEKLEDFLIYTNETLLGIFAVDQTFAKSLFIINNGGQDVTIRVYGSPTGATVEGYTNPINGVAIYTQAEIDRHYRLINTTVVVPNNNGYIDLTDFVYNYFKITGQVASGTTIINFALQQAYKGI